MSAREQPLVLRMTIIVSGILVFVGVDPEQKADHRSGPN